MRYSVLGAALLAACASAGRDLPGGLVDARTIDAPIDAPAELCTSSDTCTGAMSLGAVSGDTGNQKLNAMGSRAAWFRVHVTEDDNSVVGAPLRVGAKLTSPATADFDVFVYLNAGSNVVECSTTVGTTTTTGNVNEVRAQWGEGTVANGSNDGRDVSIEVRPISGACDASQTWQLEIQGDW